MGAEGPEEFKWENRGGERGGWVLSWADIREEMRMVPEEDNTEVSLG